MKTIKGVLDGMLKSEANSTSCMFVYQPKAPEEIDLLKQWGVDLVQGYYYTKPLDSEQIIHKLEKDVC